MTDLILTEEKLQKAKEEADAANKAKSVFLSNMSHELRNPLNAIMGFSQLLQFEKLSPVIAEHVDHIHQAGQHLLTIVNEVLDLSRVESGKAEINMENVEIDRLLRNILELAAPLATKQNIELTHQPASELQFVSADATRLSQVLLNLISNAIKYNKPQGKVLVYTQKLDGNRIRINVSDTGPGLTAEDQRKLFIPFTRLGQKNIEGTGIGLTISKQLAEIMNGKLGVESKSGSGSVFWVEFPVATPENSGITPSSMLGQPGTDNIATQQASQP